VSRRTRIVLFGSAGVLVIAGGACAALVGGVTGEVLTIVLISGGLAGGLLLVFLEIGLEEERDLARDQERRRSRTNKGARERKSLQTGGRTRLPRWPRRPS
jgi:hypothetical protein